MKKGLFILTTSLAVLFFSCSEDPNDVTKIETNGSLSVEVTGAVDLMFDDDTLAAYTHAGLLIIKATDIDENNIWLLLDLNEITNMVGDHTVARLDGEVQINFNVTEGSKSFSAESGTVTVTEYNEETIKGAFTFEAKNFSNETETISGVNGQFTASIN